MGFSWRRLFFGSQGKQLVLRAKGITMETSNIAKQIAEAASSYQKLNTGHSPKAVSVVLGDDTLVITLHEALTPAEKALARSQQGVAQVQEYHRRLFAASAEALRKEIKRITGREVREAAAEIEPATGSIVHVFTSGTMVQVFLLGEIAHEAPSNETDGATKDQPIPPANGGTNPVAGVS